MQTPDPTPLNWKPVSPPGPVTLRGRTVTLERLSAQLHAAALWDAIQGRDDLWAWLFDGPYETFPAFRQSIERKQAATDAVYLAIVPSTPDGGGIPGSPRTGLGPWGGIPGSPRTGLGPWGGIPGSPRTGLGPWGAEAAGYASYMRIDPAHGVVEVGNILLSPSLQRTTAATEAMYLMAGHVFEHLGYRRYEWKCNAENHPSRRAALRLGFTFEGIFRQHMVVKGFNRDTAWFSMLDREWPARKRAFEAWLAPANFDSEGRQRLRLQSSSS